MKSNELGIAGRRRRFVFWARAAFGVVVSTIAVLTFAALAAADPRDPIYPVSQGATWTYTGRAKWTTIGTNEIRSGNLRWTTEIIKTFSAQGLTAAIIKGFPFQLAWYNPESKPTYGVLVENTKGLFEADTHSEAEAEALAANAIGGQEVGEQLLKFPIRVGDCVGENADSLVLAANLYCWFVNKAVTESAASGWEIYQHTGPDDMTFHLIPGVGITSFVYNHHGTVAHADARLTAFHRPTNASR